MVSTSRGAYAIPPRCALIYFYYYSAVENDCVLYAMHTQPYSSCGNEQNIYENEIYKFETSERSERKKKKKQISTYL